MTDGTRPSPADVQGAVDRAFDRMVDVRRALHRRPELAFHEHETTALVRDRLRELGLDERPCPTPTGAVFTMAGGRPGPTLMLRADIDALPVQESTGSAFTSAHDGVMHACGHDVHTAMLLGTVEVLAAMADALAGQLLVVFQPAEEAVGGAEAMLRGGLFRDGRPDLALGCHVTSLAPAGMVLARAGVSMAAARSIRVVVTGHGGHAAIDPQQGNATLAASRIAVHMEEAVASLSYDGTACVCSPSVLAAGTASNVVPDRAELLGTLRTFTPEQERDAWGRLEQICAESAADLGVEISLESPAGTGAVRNDAGATRWLMSAAATLLPSEMVLEMPSPASASDDVGEFLEQIPGCYFFLGGALSDGSSGTHHSPAFAVDEAAMRVGAATMAGAALSPTRPRPSA